MENNLLLKFCVTAIFVFIIICGGFIVLGFLAPNTESLEFDKDTVIIAIILSIVLSFVNLEE
jgi:hypothetical protein